MGLFTSHNKQMVTAERALPGRDGALSVTAPQLVLAPR
jgi:hypothetical protein